VTPAGTAGIRRIESPLVTLFVAEYIVDFPGNPRQRLRVVEKIVWAPDEIQQRRDMLSKHALLVTEEGPLGVVSREEVAEIICNNFSLRRYEFYIFRSSPDPFIVIFSKRAARDLVFAS
jgi:hypothetical protein